MVPPLLPGGSPAFARLVVRQQNDAPARRPRPLPAGGKRAVHSVCFRVPGAHRPSGRPRTPSSFRVHALRPLRRRVPTRRHLLHETWPGASSKRKCPESRRRLGGVPRTGMAPSPAAPFRIFRRPDRRPRRTAVCCLGIFLPPPAAGGPYPSGYTNASYSSKGSGRAKQKPCASSQPASLSSPRFPRLQIVSEFISPKACGETTFTTENNAYVSSRKWTK